MTGSADEFICNYIIIVGASVASLVSKYNKIKTLHLPQLSARNEKSWKLFVEKQAVSLRLCVGAVTTHIAASPESHSLPLIKSFKLLRCEEICKSETLSHCRRFS